MQPAMDIPANELAGRVVRLEIITEAHREGLRKAAADPKIWQFLPMDGSGTQFDRWFDAALATQAAGTQIVYAVRRISNDRLIGSTRLANLVPDHKRVEIGYTWYATLAHGGPVNPECKLLLLDHAFSHGANRVELKTDARNTHSQAAIAKLGATQEGTLRAHMVARDGFVRDSIYFSIIRPEWPELRDKLRARLG